MRACGQVSLPLCCGQQGPRSCGLWCCMQLAVVCDVRVGCTDSVNSQGQGPTSSPTLMYRLDCGCGLPYALQSCTVARIMRLSSSLKFLTHQATIINCPPPVSVTASPQWLLLSLIPPTALSILIPPILPISVCYAHPLSASVPAT